MEDKPLILCSSICRKCKFLDWEGSDDDQSCDVDGFPQSIVGYDFMTCRAVVNSYGVGSQIIPLRLGVDNNYKVTGANKIAIQNACPYLLEHTLRTEEKPEVPTLAGLLEEALKKK